MKFILPFAFLIASSMAMHLNNQEGSDCVLSDFEEFKAKFGKVYNNDIEEEIRKKIFLEKVDEIKKHNEKFASGEVFYTKGVNYFTDLQPHEIQKSMISFDLNDFARNDVKLNVSEYEIDGEVDWRLKGAVTPVKNQGMGQNGYFKCGSCWAFSATGAIEGQWFLKKQQLLSLSEQNLVDCDVTNDGCCGGLPSRAFQYVKDHGGIDTEKSYPYMAAAQQCHYNPANAKVQITGYNTIPVGDENALAAAVSKIGPISIAISVSVDLFEFQGGIYHRTECNTISMNHAVLAVGYGHDAKSGMDYWLIKNSWGEYWAEQGYFKLARNKDNLCHVASLASYPTV